MTEIKICGITNPEDALAAVSAGAHAIGFVFAPSPRQITPEKAAAIAAAVGPRPALVGVFVDADVELVRRITQQVPLDLVQLHGSETSQYMQQLGVPAIKAFRAKDSDVIEQIRSCGVDEFLLDAHVPGMVGGTGTQVDLTLAAQASALGRMVLAGGLGPENVAQAIVRARPCAVDVSSGVEIEPGVKDHEKIRRFVNEVKKCDARTAKATSESSGASLFRKRSRRR